MIRSRAATPLPDLAAALARGGGRQRRSRGLQVAWSATLDWFAVDDEVRTLVAATAHAVAELGAELDEAAPAIEHPMELYFPIFGVDTRRGVVPLMEPDDFYPESAAEFARYPELTAEDHVGLLQRLWRLRSALDDFFAHYDVLITPATATPAFPLGVHADVDRRRRRGAGLDDVHAVLGALEPRHASDRVGAVRHHARRAAGRHAGRRAAGTRGPRRAGRRGARAGAAVAGARGRGEDVTEPPTAVAIAADVRAGRRRAVAVVEDALDRIAGLNGELNAFCEVRPRAALEAAAAVDRRIAAGDDPGPLAGVPVAVKDVVWEAGVEATDGSRSLLGFRPEQTATLLQRLLDAGAVVVGRSNIPEFCYRGIAENDLYGRTSNPWDVGRVPGGSSGGAGAAVAAGTGAARDRLRRRRLDPDPCVAVRRRRHEGHVRRRAARAAVARLVLASRTSGRSRSRSPTAP